MCVVFYRGVSLSSSKAALWLPSTVTVSVDSRGHGHGVGSEGRSWAKITGGLAAMEWPCRHDGSCPGSR